MIAYIPIRGPEYAELDNEYERFLNEPDLFSENCIIKNLLDNGEEYQALEKIKLKIIYSNKQENEEIKSISDKFSFFKTEYIEAFLKIELTLIERYIDDELFAGIIFNSIISKLSFIVNLTYATKVDFLYGIIFTKNNKYIDRTEITLSSLDDAYKHSLNIGWPKLSGLKLRDTANWYKSNNLHPDDSSKNKLHRAMNSFSYQFSRLHEKDTSVLFWTMLGIEALLAEGTSNIISQIKGKSSIILGEPKEYKKKLDQLYAYRSRLVHGDINFPAKFSSDFDNFEVKYWDNLQFATSILLALIRYLIANDKNEFQFEYKLIT